MMKPGSLVISPKGANTRGFNILPTIPASDSIIYVVKEIFQGKYMGTQKLARAITLEEIPQCYAYQSTFGTLGYNIDEFVEIQGPSILDIAEVIDEILCIPI